MTKYNTDNLFKHQILEKLVSEVYLYVCGSARCRSPAAARMAEEIARERNLEIEAYCTEAHNLYSCLIYGKPIEMRLPYLNLEEGSLFNHSRNGDKIDAVFVMETSIEQSCNEIIYSRKTKGQKIFYNGEIFCLNIPSMGWEKEDMRIKVREGIEKYVASLKTKKSASLY